MTAVVPQLRSHWVAAAAAFLLLSVVHTWPLATSPGVLSRNDNGDVQLNEWIIAWIAHQLPRAPTRLFDGNIFYPARDTLAFSEPLIVPAVIAAPALWLGASPVLAHNLLLLAGLTLTALSAYALMWAWTRDWFAALTAGSLFAFNTHTLTRLAHVQALHAYGLPLALLFADRIVSGPRRRDILGLAASMAILAYTSGYLLVFGTVLVAVVILARAADWRRNARQVVGGFAAATLLAAVAAAPIALPYRRVAIEQNMVRSLEMVREYSATLTGYLAAAGRVHYDTWSGRFFSNPVDAFFPGIAAIVLSSVAIWAALRRREHRARVLTLVILGITGVVLSLGLQTPVYGWLFAIFPPMQGLRAAARFGNLFLLAMAVLAGFGLAAVRRSPSRPAVILATSVVAVTAVNLEALRAPFEYRRFEGIPRLYNLLASEPGRVVLAETPFYPPAAVFENAEYVLNSTAHWRPLMNGYSGYIPESYSKVAWIFWYFPEDHAIQAMRAAGVTHVTVHPDRFGTDATRTIERLSRRSDFELLAIGAGSGIRLYRLR